MTQSTAVRLRLLALRRPQAARGGAGYAGMLALRLGGAALLAWIGYIHLHLWQEGYRQIPVDGPFFLLAALAAFALAAVLLAWPRPLAGLLAAGFTASTLGALLISLSVGLFGFRESISASFVVESLVLEALAVVILLAWTALAAIPHRRAASHQTRGRPLRAGRPD